MSTAYNDEESNWGYFCFIHYEEAEEYWDERWRDYYADIWPYMT